MTCDAVERSSKGSTDEANVSGLCTKKCDSQTPTLNDLQVTNVEGFEMVQYMQNAPHSLAPAEGVQLTFGGLRR